MECCFPVAISGKKRLGNADSDLACGNGRWLLRRECERGERFFVVLQWSGGSDVCDKHRPAEHQPDHQSVCLHARPDGWDRRELALRHIARRRCKRDCHCNVPERKGGHSERRNRQQRRGFAQLQIVESRACWNLSGKVWHDREGRKLHGGREHELYGAIAWWKRRPLGPRKPARSEE